jgi:hypothetical protein
MQVVTVTDQTINLSAPQSGKPGGGSINGVGQTASKFLGWFLRQSGREY